MLVQSLRISLIAAMCTALFVSVASAQKNSCDTCGEEVVCKKVCCLKCEFTEVKFTCYKSEFEDICVPCRSERCGDQCISACTCKDGADGCGKKIIFGVWQPSGAEVKTRRRLQYKTVTKKIPTFKWELKTRCHECCKGCCPATEKLPEGIPAVPECAELVDLKQAESQLNREQVQPAENTKPEAVQQEVEVVRVARSSEAPATKKATAPQVIAAKVDAPQATAPMVIAAKATASKAITPKATTTSDNAVIKVAKPVVRSNPTQQGSSK